jgi:hypothetical protein
MLCGTYIKRANKIKTIKDGKNKLNKRTTVFLWLNVEIYL